MDLTQVNHTYEVNVNYGNIIFNSHIKRSCRLCFQREGIQSVENSNNN